MDHLATAVVVDPSEVPLPQPLAHADMKDGRKMDLAEVPRRRDRFVVSADELFEQLRHRRAMRRRMTNCPSIDLSLLLFLAADLLYDLLEFGHLAL